MVVLLPEIERETDREGGGGDHTSGGYIEREGEKGERSFFVCHTLVEEDEEEKGKNIEL
jgi:hypothetical protein